MEGLTTEQQAKIKKRIISALFAGILLGAGVVVAILAAAFFMA